MPQPDYYSRFAGSRATVPSDHWGQLTFEAASFTAAVDGDLVVSIGNPQEDSSPLVRIHSECVFGEVFASSLCDCADQLDLAMGRMVTEGSGLLFYLRVDGRGAGLAAKVAATALEVLGHDTWESRVQIGVAPEGRDFRAVGDFLFDRGYRRVRLLTNNPRKVEALEECGVHVLREELIVKNPSPAVSQLYATKVSKFGHEIDTSD